ncbi:MAG: hydroxymethylglutaryl-CoA lyase [Acidobacteria bacterium]|nr:hydroxymethylglutaryl-CoA lyase [Acidobacteriota bacterium]
MALPARVRIVEVGPRDGLQNESVRVATPDKIRLVDRLADAGHTHIEVSAFVSPRWVPQMDDAEAVFSGITRRPGVRYTALVPNRTGLDRALGAGVSEVAVFAAASETFSQRNINASIEASLATYAEVCSAAAAAGLPVRGYLSTCFGCPFEGPVPPARVAELAARLVGMGVYEVALSDTIGVAHPAQIREVLEATQPGVPVEKLALHLHDTRGTALVNVYAGLLDGIATFDSSAGGLGGCPYAPGASGNLATEDLVYLLDGLGIETGVQLDGVLTASRGIEPLIGHDLPSRVYQAARARAASGR